MVDSTFLNVVIGQPYPLPVATGQLGARADFLRSSGNILQLFVPTITAEEEHVLRYGELHGGFLYDDGALLCLWQFMAKSGEFMTFDSPFDARGIPDIVLHNIDSDETRLCIGIHVVDSTSGQVRALRAITMSPELTCGFLAAVQDQLASKASGKPQHERWLTQAPAALMQATTMWKMGE